MDKDNSTKVIICLAASRKTGGRCIAGKDASDNKSWVRPVSNGEEDAIDNQQSRYPDGKLAQVLDIIEIPILESSPKQHQKENFLVDSTKKWQKHGVFDRQKLRSLLDNPPSLWQNLDSTTNGKNDRIPVSKAKNINNSLFLIQAQCTIMVKIEGKDFNNSHRKVRCSFNYNKIDYVLPVTDPIIERDYKNKEEGEYAVGQRYICISLGPEYKKFLYLFVATII